MGHPTIRKAIQRQFNDGKFIYYNTTLHSYRTKKHQSHYINKSTNIKPAITYDNTITHTAVSTQHKDIQQGSSTIIQLRIQLNH